MAKAPLKKHNENFFNMITNEIAAEEMMETASYLMEMQLKYALQLTQMILDNSDEMYKTKEIFEIFDKSCAAVSRNMAFDHAQS